MILPENGRVVIVDDNLKEVEPLMKVLSRNKVAFNYFTGNLDELPENPFSDVRIIFLDLFLEGMSTKDEKTAFSSLLGVIEKIINSQNGPFILAVWTKHPEYVEELQNRMIKSGYQTQCINLEKTDFFEQDGTLKSNNYTNGTNDIISDLNSKIETKLSNLSVFQIFNYWENLINNAAAATVSEISHLSEFNENWNDNMLKIFYNLAKAWAGESLDKTSLKEIVKSAILSLQKVYEDTLEKKVKNNDISISISFPDGNNNDAIKAKINSKILLEIPGKSTKDFYPGNVYLDNNEELRKSLVDALIDSNQRSEEMINETKLIFVEVSPLCDFLQKKLELSRYVEGLLIPTKYKGRCKKALYISSSPAIEYESNIYNIVLNFRKFTSVKEDNWRDKELIFRIRKELLNDIQNKLASHINRPGVLYLE